MSSAPFYREEFKFQSLKIKTINEWFVHMSWVLYKMLKKLKNSTSMQNMYPCLHSMVCNIKVVSVVPMNPGVRT